MAEVHDFDAAVGEIEDRPYSFMYGGNQYDIDLNVDAGRLLRWMENADKIQAIPGMLRVFLSEEQFDQITEPGETWQKMEMVVNRLAEELGSGSGN